ncbi:MAG: hypothetical protein R3B83_03895 [Nitrospirales bacterium]|nr:hypothetical protein [Nitrospirales bacterium]
MNNFALIGKACRPVGSSGMAYGVSQTSWPKEGSRAADKRMGSLSLLLKIRRVSCWALLIGFGLGHPGQGGLPDTPIPQDLTQLSLEELMSIEVTSVSKKKQKLNDSAAAIFVITQKIFDDPA